MNIKTMQLGPLGTNCYIVYDKGISLIIDPGGDADDVISFLEKESLSPQAILLTHAHFDHIGGVEALRNHYSIDVFLHEKEQAWLNDPAMNRSLYTGNEIIVADADHVLVPGHRTVASFPVEIIHTPGHSPGSVSFIFSEAGFVICGDALFRRSIGRTDLPGGDIQELESSIRNKLYVLPDHFIAYPGHGPETTIGEEKKYNPFFSTTY